MRGLKIAEIVVASLVGLVVIGDLALVLLVDPNDYRDDIAKLVEQKTGRPLEIRGKLGLKLFPGSPSRSTTYGSATRRVTAATLS